MIIGPDLIASMIGASGGGEAPAATWTVPVAGTPAVFESATTNYISITRMTDTKAIATYADNGNSNYGTAVCLSLSGTTVTAGTPFVFIEAAINFNSVCRMTDSTAIVAFYDSDNTTTKCVCLSLSGTTITAGDIETVYAGQYSYISATRMTDTRAIIAYRDAAVDGHGNCNCLSLSGTDITVGSQVEFNAAATYYTSVSRITDMKAIVCYKNDGDSGHGYACCLSLSDATVTAGTPAEFEGAATTYISVARITDTRAIVAYSDGGNGTKGTSCCLSLSDSTITAGTPVVFESGESNYNSIDRLSDTQAIVAYTDYPNSQYGSSCVLTLADTTITAGDVAVFESATSTYIGVAKLTDTAAIVAYKDAGNSNYGTACCLSNA